MVEVVKFQPWVRIGMGMCAANSPQLGICSSPSKLLLGNELHPFGKPSKQPNPHLTS